MIEEGQQRVSPLGIVTVKRKYIGPSGRWYGRWWCDFSGEMSLWLRTTGELESYPLLKPR